MNEIARRLRAGHDIGLIVTVCRCTLRLVLDLRRANQRADEIRRRWMIGLTRTLGNVNDRRIMPAEIDAAAKAERARINAAELNQAVPPPADQEAETPTDEHKRRQVIYRPPKKFYSFAGRRRAEECNPKRGGGKGRKRKS